MTDAESKEAAKPYLWLDLDDTLWNMSGNSDIVLDNLFYTDPGIHGCFAAVGSQAWRDLYHDVNVSLWKQYSSGAISRAWLRVERFRRPLVIAGMPEAEAESNARRLDKVYLDQLGRCTGLVEGAADLLRRLSEAHLRMGIISNGFAEVQFNKMKSGGIDGYFDTVVLSDDIEVNKPDRRLFDYALTRAGVSAGSSVIIGDNPDTDIFGALRAGWSAVWFNPRGMDVPENLEQYAGRWIEVRSLAEIVPEMLVKLAAGSEKHKK